jgi:hypothetical protein
MSAAAESGADHHRRHDVRAAALYGLDYVEVSAGQLALEVFFLGKAPPKLARANIRIEGGRRIRDIHVTELRVRRQSDPALDEWLELELDRFGDHAPYTLSLVQLDKDGQPTGQPLEGFDPRYASVSFSFKASCPTDLDCAVAQACPPARLAEPEINYLAKDYESFRRLILDRLALTMPGWTERHIPDLGITLVELLAYTGDYLSYYQDAVATEAYLDTARQRISVRRHARLVDYAMHEGCNARAWVTIATDTDTPSDQPLDPADFYFCTAPPQSAGFHVLGPILSETDLAALRPGSVIPFAPVFPDKIALRRDHSEIGFYAWGDSDCCLPVGATSATLVDRWVLASVAASEPDPKDASPSRADPATPRGAARRSEQASPAAEPTRALALKVGDVLIFEEVIGPGTGSRADADPRRRQAVRLTSVTPGEDPLYHQEDFPDRGRAIVEIGWCDEDALTFPLCLSARGPAPDCKPLAGISVARGNVVLVENTRPVTEPIGTVGTRSSVETCPTDCDPGEIRNTPERLQVMLAGTPLTFRDNPSPGACSARLIEQDPRRAMPQVGIAGARPDGAATISTHWTARRDLLDSASQDLVFMAEMDDDGRAHLRFGDDRHGRMPEAGTVLVATYGLGNGPAGNVGADTITCLVFRNVVSGFGAMAPRNPLPATGGTAAESSADARMFAPHAFRATLERAITAEDYAALASDDARRRAGRASTIVPFRRLQGAKAALRWTGSWYEAGIAVDPLGQGEADAALTTEIESYLDPYRRVGHDLRVESGRYVALDLALYVCVAPDVVRGQVAARLHQVLGSRVSPDGSLGLFHPDNLGFGTDLSVSRIIAAVQVVPGVTSVRIMRLRRYRVGEQAMRPDDPPEPLPSGGILAFSAFEIPRLDDDPSVPENGRVTLHMRGGR